MTRRLLLSYLTITVVVLVMLELPLAVFYGQRERERLIAEADRDASVIATLYEDVLESGDPVDPLPAEQYNGRTGVRVVVVDKRGVSVVDTGQPTPRDFSTRPEIALALTGSRASGTRRSDTLQTDLLFVAIPVASGGIVHGALRLTLDTSQVDARIHRFWAGLLIIAAIVIAVMAVVGWAIARSVTRPIRLLNETATRYARGDLQVHERQLASAPPEIEALDDTMSTMAVRLAALIDEQRAFVADASHQLRTPLTALRLRLENLQARMDDRDAAELETAIDETGRLAVLVADLLHLARADEHRPLQDADLAQLAVERVDTWSAVAESQGVRLRLAGADRPAIVSTVPGAIEQVLDNTLDNALRFAPAGSEVAITVERVGARYRLSVADHGPGLSDADKVRAINRFWRASTATSGTGLGLAIATALVKASGGSLTLVDSEGAGLTVLVDLPPGRQLISTDCPAQPVRPVQPGLDSGNR